MKIKRKSKCRLNRNQKIWIIKVQYQNYWKDKDEKLVNINSFDLKSPIDWAYNINVLINFSWRELSEDGRFPSYFLPRTFCLEIDCHHQLTYIGSQWPESLIHRQGQPFPSWCLERHTKTLVGALGSKCSILGTLLAFCSVFMA